MKTTFKFIIAAMAAIAVFASCQKEMAIETANSTDDGVRVISAQFDNSTKASLDGLKPSFEDGDLIRVSNDTKSEVCTLSVSGSAATFTTTLSGALTAIYPEDAAVLSSDAADAPIEPSDNIKVSTSQTGLVKDAIIVKATVAAGENTATFNGQTAVFRITPGAADGTEYVEVITAGPEIANTTTTEYTKKNKIHVATTAADEVFVSVLVPTGLKLRDLSFADGSNIKTVNNTTEIAANTIYTITSSDWDEPYVEIEMTVGTETQKYKWATRNIGASSETEYGDYFMWGETTGITPSGNSFSFPDTQYYTADNNTWSQDRGFAWENCPWTDGVFDKELNKNVFTKYTSSNDYAKSGTADTKTKLDLADDAANANWGGSWRMPTVEEFDALTSGIGTRETNGYKFGTSPNQIFLPAAGDGYETILDSAGGYYWSSSLNTDNPFNAYYLYFSDDDADTLYSYRCTGQSVRALSD